MARNLAGAAKGPHHQMARNLTGAARGPHPLSHPAEPASAVHGLISWLLQRSTAPHRSSIPRAWSDTAGL
jgi:hypothetical protein